MSTNPGTSGASPHLGSASHKWLFSKKEMLRAKSIQEGFSPEKELKYRQLATRFIQETVDELNIPFKEKSGKMKSRTSRKETMKEGKQMNMNDEIHMNDVNNNVELKLTSTQLCMCAASIHMHRFFYFHSFKSFNYMDIAAACLFLAGKSEESPRKLSHICDVWWAKKFPKHPRFPSDKHKQDAMALIVQLENVVLQTIAFDLKIELPHPVVLNLMHGCIGTAANDHGNKKLTEIAYFFATDVLCVTSWGIRYSAADIAVCCVHIMCTWSSHEIPPRPDGLPWYHKFDPTMTDEILQEMTDEFLQIYSSCKDKIALSLNKYSAKGFVRLAPRPSATPTPKIEPKVEPLPPPPAPPTLAKKVDYAEYKERVRSAAPGAGDSGSHSTDRPRKSFIPDTSQAARTELPTINLPGMEPLPPVKKEHSSSSDSSRRRDERKEEERRKEKERRREERRREERPEDRERRKEEERRKREHDRISGRGDPNGAGHASSKKPRPDVPSQMFVPAGTVGNGHNSLAKSLAQARASLPNGPPPPVRRPGAVPSPPKTSSIYQPASALSPPPPPPPMKLSPPPPPPPPMKMELEEGEVE